MQIITENLGKRFNREWIFRNLTQQFDAGKVYALIGANGSGKSTLLQTLWGQLPPSEGAFRYLNSNQVEIPPDEIYQHISIATPYMELIDEFSLEEMVDFHFRFKAPIYPKREAIDRMELSHAKAKRIVQFSSGMRQRLKLALAFYSATEVLFLDEPTTNLDQKSTQWYLDQLASVHQKIVIIASNQAHEYPQTAIKINLADHKAQGYNRHSGRI